MWAVRCGDGCGDVRGVAVWRVVECAVGGSVMPCRVAERAVSGTRDGTNGEMRGETGVVPFLSARLGGLSDGGGVVDGCGREVCRGRGGGVIRMSLLFFSCLSYRMRPGEATSPPSRLLVSLLRLVLAFRGGFSFIASRPCFSFPRLVVGVSL